jgi:hypothetical protein
MRGNVPKPMREAKRPSDVSDAAVTVSDVAVRVEENQSGPEKAANAAAELGRLGGAARARKLTAEQRTEIARKAAAGRWSKAK